MHAIEFSRKWAELLARTAEGRSALLVAPRFYGKHRLFEKHRIGKGMSGERVTSIHVSSRIPSIQGLLDYVELWDALRDYFDKVPTRPVNDRESFKRAFESSVAKQEGRVQLLVRGGGRGNEDNHYELIALLHKLMVTRPEVEKKVNVIATDDYSLFYWSRRPFLESALHSYQPEIHIPRLELPEIAAFVRSRCEGLAPDGALAIAEQVLATTGGHPGLITEFIDDACEGRPAEIVGEWPARVKLFQRTSRILESISRALSEDPDGYCKTALDYEEPALPETNSPRVHTLRQLGVLQRASATSVRLCEGAITTLIQEMKGVTTTARHVGTVLSEAGPRIFITGEMVPADSDLVVIHLSDLHVSEHYRHRLGSHRNTNDHSAGELIADDLDSMGLRGRVDALIITGDLVWNADLEEFLRAREIVDEILGAVGVGRDRLLIIPGNHDIKWNPGALAIQSAGSHASREAYDVFANMIRANKNGRTLIETMEVESRAGDSVLRVVGLDSNRVEGPDAPGIGFVSHNSLRQCRDYLREKTQADRGTKRRSYTWVGVHHHIFPACSLTLADAEQRHVSVMANASEVIDFANQMQIEAVLHGHEHQPSVTVARRWPIDEGQVFAPLVSIGAGSFGVAREYLGPFARNQYFIIHRRPKDMVVRSRSQGSAGVKFVSHSDLHIPRAEDR